MCESVLVDLWQMIIIRRRVYGNLIAGQHTTSAALVWILKFVTDYPEVQARLLSELETVLGGHEKKGPPSCWSPRAFTLNLPRRAQVASGESTLVRPGRASI